MCSALNIVAETSYNVHETNLFIEVRDAALDVASDNIDCLMKYIQLICEQWDIILQEAKLVAQNKSILSNFSLSRYLSTQSEAEQHHKVKTFIPLLIQFCLAFMVDSTQRHICTPFGFL